MQSYSRLSATQLQSFVLFGVFVLSMITWPANWGYLVPATWQASASYSILGSRLWYRVLEISSCTVLVKILAARGLTACSLVQLGCSVVASIPDQIEISDIQGSPSITHHRRSQYSSVTKCCANTAYELREKESNCAVTGGGCVSYSRFANAVTGGMTGVCQEWDPVAQKGPHSSSIACIK